MVAHAEHSCYHLDVRPLEIELERLPFGRRKSRKAVGSVHNGMINTILGLREMGRLGASVRLSVRIRGVGGLTHKEHTVAGRHAAQLVLPAGAVRSRGDSQQGSEMGAQSRKQFAMQIEAIMRTERHPTAPKVQTLRPDSLARTVDARQPALARCEPFGRWLLAQRDRAATG